MRVSFLVILACAMVALAGPGSAQEAGQHAASSQGGNAHRSRACVGPVCVSLNRAPRNKDTADPTASTPSAPTLPTPIPSDIPGGDEPGCHRQLGNGVGGSTGNPGGSSGTVVVAPPGGSGGGSNTTPQPVTTCPRPLPPIPTPPH